MSRLPVRTKLAYGLGQVGQQIKASGFDTFLFFYYQQVLGLSAALAGLAVLIALVFDAVSDPLAGVVSDNWRSKHGRRHPFMYASALPMALFWLLLFFPPEGMGQAGLFAWLLTFSVLVRGAMTLYGVPYLALGAELSDDYQERTSVSAYRTLCGVLGGVAVIVIALRYFFPETQAFANGLLNPEGYPKLAIFGAVGIALSIWISAWGTRDLIPRLPGPPAEPVTMQRVFGDIGAALANRSFLSLFVGFSIFALAFGFNQVLGTHMNVFFWELQTDQISVLPPVFLLGFVLGIPCTAPLHRMFDKKRILIVTSVATVVLGNSAVVLRLLGLLPANGTQELLLFVAVALLVLTFLGGIVLTSVGSMMADVAQQYELERGASGTGVLFSSMSFAPKVASALGHGLAGLALEWIAFPTQATDPSLVDSVLVRNLGLVSLGASLVGATCLFAFLPYDITREKQREIAERLARRAQERAESGDVAPEDETVLASRSPALGSG